jgi:hypothetical protein
MTVQRIQSFFKSLNVTKLTTFFLCKRQKEIQACFSTNRKPASMKASVSENIDD